MSLDTLTEHGPLRKWQLSRTEYLFMVQNSGPSGTKSAREPCQKWYDIMDIGRSMSIFIFHSARSN